MTEPDHRQNASAHACEAAAVLQQQGVDAAFGLSATEAAARLNRFGPNALRERARTNALQILLAQLNNPIVYLLLVATALALLMGEWVESVFVLIVLVINTLIGFATEWQAMRSMDALRELSGNTARVRRDRVVGPVSATQLVPGDVVLLSAGELVAADMRLLSSAGLTANESALTGEAFPIIKSTDALPADTILAERCCMVYQGTAITAGSAEAVVVATGMQTELGHISELVETAQPERTPLERQLAELSRHLIWLTLAVTAILVVTGYLAGRDLMLMLQTALALAVAAIPEGLPIVATLALARGVLRMARHNALVEHLPTVETLGATTMILTDKTGTLTENDMRVERIVTAAGHYRSQGEGLPLAIEDALPEGRGDAALPLLLRNAALCNDASLGTGDIPPSGDTMEIALLRVAAAENPSPGAQATTLPRLAAIPFQTETRMMATLHCQHGVDAFVAVKGAPEAVLEICESVQQGSDTAALDADARAAWQDRCETLASAGLRLLAVAGKAIDLPPETTNGTREVSLDPATAYQGLTLFGIVAFQDPPRADVAPAIADARNAGIAIVMVTGDHAATATHIATSVGIDSGSQPGMGGQQLGQAADWSAETRERLRSVRIFSRLAPVQKLDLIRLHQDAGEVVAMTGDGVNDAPALRQADIGIAMGQRGTQVARQAAELVLHISMSDASRARLILLFGLVTYGMGQSLLYVIFGPLAREIGLVEWQFGVLIAASNVAIVIFSPLWGRASEKAGRKSIYLLGLVGFAVGYAALAFGIQAGLAGWLAPMPLFLTLLGARLIYGVMAAAIQPAATAYVADTTDAASRGQGMALIAAAGGIGTIVGPAFGGLLARFGALLPMYAAAGLALVAVVVTSLRLSEPARHVSAAGDTRMRIGDQRVFPYLLGWFVVFMVFTGVQVVTPFIIEDRFGVSGREAVTQVAMIALLSMALTTLVVQIVVMQVWKLGPRFLLRYSYFLFGAALLALAWAAELWQLYALFALMGLSVAMATPGLNAAATLNVEAHEQGAVAGLLAAAPAFGMIFGPALGGAVYNLSPAYPLIGGAVLAILMGGYFLTVRIPDPHAA